MNICNIQCTGNEWDSINQIKWIEDTLNSLTCIDSLCLKKTIQAGFVDVRGIKVIFIRTICYTKSDLTEFNEEVKFYDCGGHIIKLATCINGQFCSTYGDITEAQVKALVYNVKWDCDDKFKTTTSITDFIKDKFLYENNSTWSNLDCYPLPVKDFLICKVIKNDIPVRLQFFNLLGNRFSVPFSYLGGHISIDAWDLTPGIYILNIIGKKRNYRTKILVD